MSSANGQLRLNVGCGLNAPNGWVNIDRSPNILLDRVTVLKEALHRLGFLKEAHMARWPRNVVRADVVRGLDYPSGAAEAIYSSHMLEHIYLSDARRVLTEFHRLLRPSGIVRVALPDSEALARAYVDGLRDNNVEAAWDFNRELWTYDLERPTWRQRLVTFVGGAAPHRWQPSPLLATALLEEAGFSDVTQRRFHEGDLPDLESVEHRTESFFLEARRGGEVTPPVRPG